MKSVFRSLASTRNSLLWFFHGAGSLLVLWGLRMPGGDIPCLLAGASLVVIALLFAAARVITRWILTLRKRPGVAPVFAGWQTWTLGALVIFVIGLVGTLGLPFRLAFAVSRPRLDQVVQAHTKGQPPKGGFWAGLFPFSSVEPVDGGLQFTYRKSEFPWGKRGVYCSASGERLESSRFHDQERIDSKWFSWHYGGW